MVIKIQCNECGEWITLKVPGEAAALCYHGYDRDLHKYSVCGLAFEREMVKERAVAEKAGKDLTAIPLGFLIPREIPSVSISGDERVRVCPRCGNNYIGRICGTCDAIDNG